MNKVNKKKSERNSKIAGVLVILILLGAVTTLAILIANTPKPIEEPHAKVVLIMGGKATCVTSALTVSEFEAQKVLTQKLLGYTIARCG